MVYRSSPCCVCVCRYVSTEFIESCRRPPTDFVTALIPEVVHRLAGCHYPLGATVTAGGLVRPTTTTLSRDRWRRSFGRAFRSSLLDGNDSDDSGSGHEGAGGPAHAPPQVSRPVE